MRKYAMADVVDACWRITRRSLSAAVAIATMAKGAGEGG